MKKPRRMKGTSPKKGNLQSVSKFKEGKEAIYMGYRGQQQWSSSGDWSSNERVSYRMASLETGYIQGN